MSAGPEVSSAVADRTAKIVRFHKLGGPEVLRIEEMPLPEPGPGEARLRVQAIGLNRSEVSFREGKYLVHPVLPSKLGYEAAGVVEAVGEGVSRALLGQKRSTVPAFSADKYGVYGEVAIVPEHALAAYPEELTPEQATSIWMQYLTAYGALIHFGRMAKSDFVLITAASSSVGVATIEMVKVEGAISIATTRSASKKAELLSLGANHVIVSGEEDVANRVKEITGGKEARLIFDSVAGPGIKKLAEAAAEQGMMFLYGALSGESTPFPLYATLKKHLWIKGYTVFEFAMDPVQRGAAEKYVYDHVASRDFRPRIDRVFKLAQIGKIVVTI